MLLGFTSEVYEYAITMLDEGAEADIIVVDVRDAYNCHVIDKATAQQDDEVRYSNSVAEDFAFVGETARAASYAF